MGRPLRGSATLTVSPSRMAIGDGVQLQVSIRSDGSQSQKLVIDCAVNTSRPTEPAWPRCSRAGRWNWRPSRNARSSSTVQLRPTTTRKYRAGRHVVDLRVNIVVMARSAFDLTV